MGVERNDEAAGIGSAQCMIESISVVLFVEGNDGYSCLDAAHLGHNTLSGAGLVSIEDKLVTWGETGLK